jgi:hypothetical protein
MKSWRLVTRAPIITNPHFAAIFDILHIAHGNLPLTYFDVYKRSSLKPLSTTVQFVAVNEACY